MSRVTNVILAHSVCEECNMLLLVNAELRKEDYGCFTAAASQSILVGGDKCMEVCVYLAAFNYLNLDILRTAITKTPWSRPESVQLFVCDEDDERFREVEWNVAADGRAKVGEIREVENATS